MKQTWRLGSPLGSLGRRVGMWIVVLGAVSGFGGAAHADVTAPFDGTELEPGESFTIAWDPLASCSTVDIRLYRGTVFVCDIATGVPDDGTHDWTVESCGLPGCNYSLRISCSGGEQVRSSFFSIGGRLLSDVEAGSRNVTLLWDRVPGDTLGAERQVLSAPTDSTAGLTRVFGGYNVWRRVYDNQLDPSLSERFTKLRTYDVQKFNTDTVPTAWSFPQAVARFGPVLVQVDEDETELQTFVAAQTFTTPASGYELCNVRMYNGPVFRRWRVTMTITSVLGGVPQLNSPLATAQKELGTLANPTGFLWQTYTLPSRLSLSPNTQYAIVFTAVRISPPDDETPLMTWVGALYDAFPDGNAFVSSDGGATWVSEESDFAFVLGGSAPAMGQCRDLAGQRRGGDRARAFNDPESILAFDRDEEGQLIPLTPTGPFDGFELEYAVTAFERVLVSSGNTERTSPCEDTLFTDSGFPLGVQPTELARWPELIFPRSSQPNGPPLLREVYPVPNPYVRDRESASFPRWERPGERRIDFVNLPAGAEVRLYSLAGDFLRSLTHDASHGTATWDLRNESGEIVVSGVYIWMVTAPNGEQKRGQLVIVR